MQKVQVYQLRQNRLKGASKNIKHSSEIMEAISAPKPPIKPRPHEEQLPFQLVLTELNTVSLSFLLVYMLMIKSADFNYIIF